jgi:FAD/FMN-containing dehydrogenase
VGVSADILAAFAARLGPKGCVSDPDLMAPMLTDWRGLYHGQAAAALFPSVVADVQAIMALAREHRIPLVPQGGNTSMVGGATPPNDGSCLIVSTRRMTAVRAIDVAAGFAVAEAGVVLEALHQAAAEQGLRFPLTLGAKGSATVGGLTATNAGGTQVLRFGTMRKLVLGVEAVLPDGSLHSGLAPLKKDTRGYDLDQLLIGSEGTIGIITAAALRLVPQPVDLATAWCGVESPHAALRLLRWLEAQSGDAVESFEIIPDHSVQAVLAHLRTAQSPLESPAAWHVLIDFAGANARARLEVLLGDALDADLLSDAMIAANAQQAGDLWTLRDSVSAAERALGPAISHDISVPVDAMPDFMTTTARRITEAFPGLSASGYGHLGDGNIHFHVRAPKMAAEDAQAWRAGQGKTASQMVYDLVVAAGGSISAEHGIGQMKRDELVRVSPPGRIAALQAIKAAIDPLGLMNPGKLVPLASRSLGQ